MSVRKVVAGRALLQAIETYVVEVLDMHKGPDGWIDQYHSPLGRRAHLQAVRAGKLRGFKRGKKVFVRQSDVDAFLEDHPVPPEPGGASTTIERSLRPRDVAAKALDELGFELR